MPSFAFRENTNSSSDGLMRHLIILLVLSVSGFVAADERMPTVTPQQCLGPQSTACQLLLTNAMKSFEAGRKLEALVAIEGVLQHPQAHMGVVWDERVVAARVVAEQFLLGLSPDEQEIYRNHFRKNAERLLEAYRKTHDPQLLRNLVAWYPILHESRVALPILIGLALDQGDQRQAASLRRLLVKTDPDAEEDSLFQAHRCLIALRLNRLELAQDALRELQRQKPDFAGIPQLQALLLKLKSVHPLSSFQTDSESLVTLWRRDEFPTLRPRFWWGETADPFECKRHGRMFNDSVQITEGVVVQRLGYILQGLDLATGWRLWQHQFGSPDAVRNYQRDPRKKGRLAAKPPKFSPTLLFDDVLGRGLLVSTNRCFAILERFDHDKPGNILRCLDASSGETLWSVEPDAVIRPEIRTTSRTLRWMEGIAIDGDFTDWNGQNGERIELDMEEPKAGRTKMDAIVGYNDSGIVGLIQVRDNTVMQRNTERATAMDHVSLRFTEHILNGGMEISLGAKGNKAYQAFDVWTKSRRRYRAHVRGAHDGDGYRIEFALPWSTFEMDGPGPWAFRLEATVINDGPGAAFRRYKARFAADQGESAVLRVPVKLVESSDQLPWRTNGNRFIESPKLLGSRLIVAYQRSSFLGLAAIDSHDGRLLWERDLMRCDAATRVTGAALEVRGSRAYLTFPRGVLACVDLGRGLAIWTVSYLKALPLKLTQTFPLAHKPDEIPVLPAWQHSTLIPLSDRLLLFPADRAVIVAFDSETGKPLFEQESLGFSYVLGHVGTRAFVANSQKLACFDMTTGTWKWQRSLANSQGRGCVLGDKLLVPDDKQILLLSQADGSVEQRLDTDADNPLTNLLSTEGGVVTFGALSASVLMPPVALPEDVSPLPALRQACLLRAQGRLSDSFAQFLQALPDTTDVDYVRESILRLLPKLDDQRGAAMQILDHTQTPEAELRIAAADVLLKEGKREQAQRVLRELQKAPPVLIRQRRNQAPLFPLHESSRHAAGRRLSQRRNSSEARTTTPDPRFATVTGYKFGGFIPLGTRLVRTGPFIAEGKRVMRLATETGTLAWTRELPVAADHRSSICATNTQLLLLCEGVLLCMSTDDGTILWQREFEADALTAAVQYGELLCIMTDARIVAVDAASGEPAWSRKAWDATPLPATIPMLSYQLHNKSILYLFGPGDGRVTGRIEDDWGWQAVPIDRQVILYNPRRMQRTTLSGDVVAERRFGTALDNMAYVPQANVICGIDPKSRSVHIIDMNGQQTALPLKIQGPFRYHRWSISLDGGFLLGIKRERGGGGIVRAVRLSDRKLLGPHRFGKTRRSHKQYVVYGRRQLVLQNRLNAKTSLAELTVVDLESGNSRVETVPFPDTVPLKRNPMMQSPFAFEDGRLGLRYSAGMVLLRPVRSED